MDIIIELFNTFAGTLGDLLFPVIFVAAVALVLNALYAYKFFEIEFSIICASVLGLAGFYGIKLFIEPSIALPEGINVAALVGFILAIVGALLSRFLLKVFLFLDGAAAGFLLSYLVFTSMLEPSLGVYVWIVHIICAVLLGIIFLLAFKFVYIMITSVLGMIVCACLVELLVLPSGGALGLIGAIVVGLIAGIFTAGYQYRLSRDYYKIFY